VDRLSELKRLPDEDGTEDKGSDESDVETANSNDEDEENGHAGEDNALLEDFFQRIEELKTWITAIRNNMGLLRQKYTELLTITNTKKANKLRQELGEIRSSIQSTASQLHQALNSLKKENDEFNAVHDNDPSLCKIRTNMHGSLVRKFFNLMQEYQSLLSTYDSKMREAAVHEVKVVSPDADEEEINLMLDRDEGATNIFARKIMKDDTKKKEEAKQKLDYLKEKQSDIEQIEKSMNELHQLFLDMQILVEAQGELVDQIEYSVSKSKEYHERAERVLQDAENIVVSTRKKKLCFIITAVLIIGIIVVIILILVGVIPPIVTKVIK